MTEANGNTASQIDYDLYGIVGIRLLGASNRDCAAVKRQLGLAQSLLKREPDIVIRFVDKLPNSNVRYLDVDDAAYTDDAFIVLRSKHKARTSVQIPMAQVGMPCEIVCEHGVPSVPLLIPILNLTALGKGVLAVHASAFRYKGTGVLTTGWAKGGKTETLLAFMAQGAEYIGDEWVYLSCEGRRMFGIPEPIKIWDWHLRELPQYRRQIKRSDQARLTTLRLLVRAMDRMQSGKRHGFFPAYAASRVLPLLKRQLFIHISPPDLFGDGLCKTQANLEKVIFVVSHASRAILVERMNSQEIARRIVFSLQYERLNFWAYYLKSRFAFPAARNQIVECAEEIQRELLTRALEGIDSYGLYHPYPVSIPALFKAMSHLVSG